MDGVVLQFIDNIERGIIPGKKFRISSLIKTGEHTAGI